MEERYYIFRWFVIAANSIAVAASGMILISPAPLVGAISQEWGIDLGSVTAVTMLPFTLFVAIGSIVGGIFIDKMGLRKTYLFSIIVAIIGILLMPIFRESITGIISLRAIQGLGSGPLVASISRIAAEWFPPKERALVTGMQSAGLSLGIAIGFTLSPWIFSKTNDWVFTIFLVGGGQLIALIMMIIFALVSKRLNSQKSNQGNDIINFRLAIKKPVFWIGTLIVFSMSWITQAFNDLTPGYIAVPAPIGNGLGPQMAGNIMSLYQIAGIIGAIISGFVLEKVFKGKTRILLMIVFILGGIFTILLVSPLAKSNIIYLLICLLSGGFLLKFVNPICMAFISKSYSKNITGKLGGMTMGIGIFGGPIGVSVGSLSLHNTGYYVLSIIIISAMCFLGFVLSFGINTPKVS